MDAVLRFLYSVWNVLFSQFLTIPSLLLAVIVAVGYALLRRPFAKVVSGAIKTAVGILILQVGSAQLQSTFRPLIELLAKRFGLVGTIIDPYAANPAAMQFLGDRSAWVGYVILIGLAVNVVLVLTGKFKAIFLTGHILFLQSALVTALVAYTFGLGLLPTVLIAGILVGIYWAIGSHILITPMKIVTNDAGVTLGHQQMFMDWIVYKLARRVGDPKDSTENLQLPGWLNMFQDNVVTMATIMVLFVFAIVLAIGPALVQTEMAKAQHWFVYTLLTGLGFAVNVTIILTGVRMFVAELANSFKGISEKLLPGTTVAVDAPVVFAFGPNAVLLGFLCTVVGQLLGIGALLLFRSPQLIIPGFVPLFFDGGTVGVFANKFGGWKAVVVFCIVLGLCQVFGSALIIPMSGLKGGWQGNFDWGTYWLGVTWIMRLVAGVLGLPAN